MTVHTLNLTCRGEPLAERIADALEPVADAVSYFELDDAVGWTVSAYFEDPPDETAIRRTVATASGDESLLANVDIRLLGEKDWVAESQRLLPPVHAGGFIIHGSHDRDTVPRSRNAIEIDAGAAFGTAHHGTTTGCLEAIDTLTRSQDGCPGPMNILDLGTGSAILAIAAHRRWPSAGVLAGDIDPVAIAVAERNVAENGAGNSIRFVVADGLSDQAIAARTPFDLIIANILAGPLIALAAGICGALVASTNERIILSGLLDDQAGDVLAAYKVHGLTSCGHISRNGWSTLILRRNPV